MSATEIHFADGADTGDILAGILQGIVNLQVDVHLRDGETVRELRRSVVRMEITEIDGYTLIGNGIDTSTDDYEPDEDDPEAIRGYGFDFNEIAKVVVL